MQRILYGLAAAAALTLTTTPAKAGEVTHVRVTRTVPVRVAHRTFVRTGHRYVAHRHGYVRHHYRTGWGRVRGYRRFYRR